MKKVKNHLVNNLWWLNFWKTTDPLVHANSDNGHRASYKNIFADLLGYKTSIGSMRGKNALRLISAKHLILATIDDDYFGFIFIALIRTILLRKTTGIFVRSLQCFRIDRPVVYTLKRWLFCLLRRLPALKLLSILPYEVRPELAKVTRDWIYDPQLWDLWINGQPMLLPHTSLSSRVASVSEGKSIVIFIGTASKLKGFHELAKIARFFSNRLLVVVAGQVDLECSEDARSLSELGMIIEDRYVSDDEILSLYAIADYAWCCYAESYDQASGVFGRAVQTGIVPIIRLGSVLEKLATQLMVNFVVPEDLMKCSRNQSSITPAELTCYSLRVPGILTGEGGK